MRSIDIIVIVVYMFGMLGIGFYARGKINNMDDFILGGKRFTVFLLTATIMATMTGAGMTLGMVGAVFKRGSGIMWDLTGVAIGLFAMALIAAKLRETNKRSLAEVIAGSSGPKPQIAVAIVAMVPCSGAPMPTGASGALATRTSGTSTGWPGSMSPPPETLLPRSRESRRRTGPRKAWGPLQTWVPRPSRLAIFLPNI